MTTKLWQELGGGAAQIKDATDTTFGAIKVTDLEGINGKLYAVTQDTDIWVLDTHDAAPKWELIGTGVAAIAEVNGDLYGALLDDTLVKLDL